MKQKNLLRIHRGTERRTGSERNMRSIRSVSWLSLITRALGVEQVYLFRGPLGCRIFCTQIKLMVLITLLHAISFSLSLFLSLCSSYDCTTLFLLVLLLSCICVADLVSDISTETHKLKSVTKKDCKKQKRNYYYWHYYMRDCRSCV